MGAEESHLRDPLPPQPQPQPPNSRVTKTETAGEKKFQILEERKTIQFILNGKLQEVEPGEVESGLHLVEFIRNVAGLKGTKRMCREGGCGACTVSIQTTNLQTGAPRTFSVNSCLVPLPACDGWEITTVEKVGNSRSGLHPIQQRLVSFGGTQCGFCTPGMVMAMYSMSQQHSRQHSGKLSAHDIETNLDGNICRCTGYRSILDAFKSLAHAPNKFNIDLDLECPGDLNFEFDIEDWNLDRKCSTSIFDYKQEETVPGTIRWTLSEGEEWVKVHDLQSLFETMARLSLKGVKYRLVAGNTAAAIYKDDDGPCSAFIDVSRIEILQRVKVHVEQSPPAEDLVELGGGVSIAIAMDALERSSQFQGFEYTAQVSAHLQRIGTCAVRNVGTLAGNLMLKHAHPEFPSDLFVLLETVGAKLSIASAPSLKTQYSPVQFLSLDMPGKVILSVRFPKLEGRQILRSFKIAPRFQNSSATVNAGFLIKTLQSGAKVLVEEVTIVYGGISSNFVHATKTENYLRGLNILEGNVVENCLEILQGEIAAEGGGGGGGDRNPESADYPHLLAQTLLFKFLVHVLGEKVNPLVTSAGTDMERRVSTGVQDYDTDSTQWPLYQPIPKVEAVAQCSGEAEYIDDMAPEEGELFGVFVLSQVASADLTNIDASQAMGIPGVVAFLEAKDVPGLNNYMAFAYQNEPIFASGKIEYAGQAVGLIVAENRLIALKASKQVQVLYENIQKPILTIEDAIKFEQHTEVRRGRGRGRESLFFEKDFGGSPQPQPNPQVEADHSVNNLVPEIFQGRAKFEFEEETANNARKDDPSFRTISGEFKSGSQYHFHMETQTCICVPKEDCLKVYSSTQWMDRVQFALSQCLALPSNYFQLEVRRLGGGYGGKISRSAHVACACAIAAYHLNKPVRICLDLDTNMEMIGGRLPYLTKYQGGVSAAGKLESLNVTVICDSGWSSNEITSRVSTFAMQSCYEATKWKIKPQFLNTNTAPKTFCRAPGTTEAIAGIEVIMDHIAFELKKDPMEIRLLNLIKPGDPIYGAYGLKFQNVNLIPSMLQSMEISGNISARKELVREFNSRNRWKKRGLSLLPMRYPVHGNLSSFKATVVIYHVDGSVVVTHSGIEMGQGIHTKVVQVVAHALQVPLGNICVRPTNNVTSPNATVTGGSVTSEYCCFAVMEACRILLDRMAPTRTKLGGSPSWEVLVKEAQKDGVDLMAAYQLGPRDAIKSYDVWGLTATEVEIDCLTGEYKILRCDLMEDAGKSMSPDIDLGQVEGSLIMGFGLWLTEQYKYDSNTGRLLTNSTWNYKPPLPKDIPEDFRVTLLKNSDNPFGVLRSKATGEPAVCMSSSVLFALKWAITSARADAGNHDWFQLDGPVTPRDILRHCLTSPQQLLI